MLVCKDGLDADFPDLFQAMLPFLTLRDALCYLTCFENDHARMRPGSEECSEPWDEIAPLTDMLKLLLDCGANVHRRNRNGKTPLDLALDGNQGPIARLLLAYGADPERVQQFLTLPLPYMVVSGKPRTVYYLLALGKDPNKLDHHGHTGSWLCSREQGRGSRARALTLGSGPGQN